MSDTIHITISDVERLRARINQAEKEIKQALNGIEQALHGANWQDANRRKFEDSWQTARASADFERTARELTSQLSVVIAKAKALGGQ
jgi:hypothetical protein